MHPDRLTPFHHDGSIDHDSLRREVDWLIDAGATGLAALALASEGYKLTDSERDQVLATVIDQNAGRRLSRCHRPGGRR